jgi:AbrB family looped-hinge helix DNA binding protein
MDVVKLGSKGQISIPAAILARLGLGGGRHLIVETTADGAILLRPAGIYPIERYSDARVAEFEHEGRMTPQEEAQVERALARLRRR